MRASVRGGADLARANVMGVSKSDGPVVVVVAVG